MGYFKDSIFDGGSLGLSKFEIEHIARLARLELSEAEKEELTGELNELFKFMEKLDRLDVKEPESTAHLVSADNVYRPDMVGPSLETDEVLANAPERMNNFFKVPKILEG